MILAAAVLATYWAWQFIYAYADWLPDYIPHFLVPLIMFGMMFLPHVVLFALAGASLVGLLHRFTLRSVVKTSTLPRRRSNIPPLP